MAMNLMWLQDHLLAVVAVVLTLILGYHYLIERDTGVKLSKRYRNSIFEAQSKIFLNATQYLISGNKDLAIREFLNAVDINRETIETYFALGGLFRSNGEIEKAISIHRSLIARDNISEATRLQALKELAIDFDKGGLVDKAIETYKDVLKINRDQYDIILALCRIYESIEDWDESYNYRIMLSKVGHENQAETISHILVEKAKQHFKKGAFAKCEEDLEDAFRFAPSVSAKILRLRLSLSHGNMEQARSQLFELLKEHPLYASFIFGALEEKFEAVDGVKQDYQARLNFLVQFFLDMDDKELLASPAIILSKVRILKEMKKVDGAYKLLKDWMAHTPNSSDVLRTEYIKILIELDKVEEVMGQVSDLLENIHQSLARYFCSHCGYDSDNIFWRCPQCYEWETIQFRWKV
ncbi:MAG: hypothetical protein WCG27_02030 [Pseudomonadota bacterium]